MKMTIEKLNKKYGELEIFKDFSLSIDEGGITGILGPSGCGKTTLLNIIGGITKPDSAEFKGFEGKKTAYLFQDTRLIRWKTVKENIDFVLKEVYSKKEREEVIARQLETVGLSDFANYYPDKLSGGMKQRVAIARAFAFPANLLIMDEPFSGLDIKLKLSVMNTFIKMWNNDKRTVIFVTHDIDEALYLGDDIYILSNLPTKIKTKFKNETSIGARNYRGRVNSEMEKAFMELLIEH